MCIYIYVYTHAYILYYMISMESHHKRVMNSSIHGNEHGYVIYKPWATNPRIGGHHSNHRKTQDNTGIYWNILLWLISSLSTGERTWKVPNPSLHGRVFDPSSSWDLDGFYFPLFFCLNPPCISCISHCRCEKNIKKKRIKLASRTEPISLSLLVPRSGQRPEDLPLRHQSH